MNIKILDITEEQQNIYINFHSHCGNGVGRWEGGTPPKEGKVYTVEFDIDIIISSSNSQKSDREAEYIDTIDECLYICGIAESIDEDGMIFFRIATDCLLMVESVFVEKTPTNSKLEFFVTKKNVGIYLA